MVDEYGPLVRIHEQFSRTFFVFLSQILNIWKKAYYAIGLTSMSYTLSLFSFYL